MDQIQHRRGRWIQSYTGRRLYPLDPRAEDFCIEDIAHSLSLICRFGGHCIEHYSVAQHSLIMSKQVPERLAGWALLHDAPEIVIGDITRPVKKDLIETGFQINQIEIKIMSAIAFRFNLPFLTQDDREVLDEADVRMLATERRDVMTPGLYWTELTNVEPYDIVIRPIPWFTVKRDFLLRALEVGLCRE